MECLFINILFYILTSGCNYTFCLLTSYADSIIIIIKYFDT